MPSPLLRTLSTPSSIEFSLAENVLVKSRLPTIISYLLTTQIPVNKLIVERCRQIARSHAESSQRQDHHRRHEFAFDYCRIDPAWIAVAYVNDCKA